MLRKIVLDLPEGDSMGAPCETPGLTAPEIAMDETAEKVGIDPIEFRVLNDTQVDLITGVVRVRRMLAVCSTGRILNPKTARSPGIIAALIEDAVVDKRVGFFVNHDLAGYEVPVHADLPHQDGVFLDGVEPRSRTPFTTPPASACASTRSPSINSSAACWRLRDDQRGSRIIGR